MLTTLASGATGRRLRYLQMELVRPSPNELGFEYLKCSDPPHFEHTIRSESSAKFVLQI